MGRGVRQGYKFNRVQGHPWVGPAPVGPGDAMQGCCRDLGPAGLLELRSFLGQGFAERPSLRVPSALADGIKQAGV